MSKLMKFLIDNDILTIFLPIFNSSLESSLYYHITF